MATYEPIDDPHWDTFCNLLLFMFSLDVMNWQTTISILSSPKTCSPLTIDRWAEQRESAYVP